MKRKSKTTRRPTGREYAVAAGLNRGLSAQRACMEAGFSKSYSRSFAGKIARRAEVIQAQIECGRNIKPGHLGLQAKAVLQDIMANPKAANRELIAASRTAADIDGIIGLPYELQLHKHEQNITPQIAEMLKQDLKELMAKKNAAILEIPARSEPIEDIVPRLTAPKPDPISQPESEPIISESEKERAIAKEACTHVLLRKFSYRCRADAEKDAAKFISMKCAG